MTPYREVDEFGCRTTTQPKPERPCFGSETAYDRSHFLAHEIHITHARARTKKQLREIPGGDADTDRLVIPTGMISQPFPVLGTGEICVPIIIDGGDVLTAIRPVP